MESGTHSNVLSLYSLEDRGKNVLDQEVDMAYVHRTHADRKGTIDGTVHVLLRLAMIVLPRSVRCAAYKHESSAAKAFVSNNDLQ